MKNITTIKGTYDLLPPETEKWRKIENFIHDFMYLHGYAEIRTPVFEKTELFTRGVGEETDIVTKEMYSWTDMDKESTGLTLKPELTAPVVRAYIQHNLGAKSPLQRLYYMDSLFRRERPQKGRQRQFNQFGVEAIGSPHPEQDVEIISMAYFFYQSFSHQSIMQFFDQQRGLESLRPGCGPFQLEIPALRTAPALPRLHCPVTSAPRRPASCTAASPTPPDAPVTSTRSPTASRARVNRLCAVP